MTTTWFEAIFLSRMSGAVLGEAKVEDGRFRFRPYTSRLFPWFNVGFGRSRELDIPLARIQRSEALSPSRFPALRPMPGIRLHLAAGGPITLRSDHVQELLEQLPASE